MLFQNDPYIFDGKRIGFQDFKATSHHSQLLCGGGGDHTTNKTHINVLHTTHTGFLSFSFFHSLGLSNNMGVVSMASIVI